MSEKVKLTEKQAEALETVRLNPFHDTVQEIIRIHAVDPHRWGGEVKVLHDVPLDTIIRALYIGYEIEETPEDRVRQIYQYWDNYHGDAIYSGQTIASHILDVLNILNIKIEGVNA